MNDNSNEIEIISIKSDHKISDCFSSSNESIAGEEVVLSLSLCQDMSENIEQKDVLEIENALEDNYETAESENGFEESENDFEESDEELSAFEVEIWTPNVFLTPKEFDEDFETYNHYLDEFRLFECFRYGSNTLNDFSPPFESLKRTFGYNEVFLSRLKQLECNPNGLQFNIWSFVLKGFSISCISGPKTGKTNAFAIHLMSCFDTNEMESDIKVGAIVICSSSHKTIQVMKEVNKWTQIDGKSKVRIIVLNSFNEEDIKYVINDCNVLITTPSPLLRCIQSNMVNICNTRYLILDDADISLALHRQKILDICLAFTQNNKENDKNHSNSTQMTGNLMSVQTMIFSEKWTRDVIHFYREVQSLPILVFNSYFEASIAFCIDTNIEFVEENEREERLKQLLTKVGHKKRISIVCRNEDEIKYLIEILELQKINDKYIVINKNTNHYDLEQLKNLWKRENKILFITDSAVKSVNAFDSSECVIHYKLPKDFNDFGERFRLMKYYFKKSSSPLSRELTKDLVSYIIISPEDREQLPQLISYLKRLNIQIPDQISKCCHFDNRKLCTNWLSLAKCPLVSIYCFERHLFNEFDSPNPQLPQNEKIKIVITYVCGANDFFFRIKQFYDKNKKIWIKTSETFEKFNSNLNKLRNHSNIPFEELFKEEVYGIEVEKQVFRVKIVRERSEEELRKYDPLFVSKRIELFCIDFGHKLISSSRELFALPLELKSIPAFAFRGFVFGIKPIDNEIEWNFESNQRLYELVNDFHITAIIEKQMNDLFWFKSLKVRKRLNNDTNVSVISDPIQTLKEEKLVVEHDIQLLKVFNDYNKNNESKSVDSNNDKLNHKWNKVVVIDFESIDELYVMNENCVQILQHLENKWMQSLESLQPMSDIIEGQFCFYKYFDKYYNEYAINRAKVMSINEKTITLFLVDHGEKVECNSSDNIYDIKDIHIQEIPFQAIKVKIFGIKPLKPITYDIISELTRDENDVFLLVMALIFDIENDVNCVRLFVAKDQKETEFVSITKLLVDLNFGEYINGEENNDLNILKKNKIENGIEIEYFENEMIGNTSDDLFIKSLNIKEEIDIEVKVEEKKTESKMSKIMEKLEKIKELRKKSENIVK